MSGLRATGITLVLVAASSQSCRFFCLQTRKDDHDADLACARGVVPLAARLDNPQTCANTQRRSDAPHTRRRSQLARATLRGRDTGRIPMHIGAGPAGCRTRCPPPQRRPNGDLRAHGGRLPRTRTNGPRRAAQLNPGTACWRVVSAAQAAASVADPTAALRQALAPTR